MGLYDLILKVYKTKRLEKEEWTPWQYGAYFKINREKLGIDKKFLTDKSKQAELLKQEGWYVEKDWFFGVIDSLKLFLIDPKFKETGKVRKITKSYETIDQLAQEIMKVQSHLSNSLEINTALIEDDNPTQSSYLGMNNNLQIFFGYSGDTISRRQQLTEEELDELVISMKKHFVPKEK